MQEHCDNLVDFLQTEKEAKVLIHSESFSQYSSKVRCTFYITSMETCRPGKKSSGKNLGFFTKLPIKTSNKLDFAIYFHNVFFLSESIAGIRKDFSY